MSAAERASFMVAAHKEIAQELACASQAVREAAMNLLAGEELEQIVLADRTKGCLRALVNGKDEANVEAELAFSVVVDFWEARSLLRDANLEVDAELVVDYLAAEVSS